MIDDVRSLSPAMELSTEQLQEVLHGRKEFFDHYYFALIGNLKRNERRFFRYVAEYRDKNVEVLSTPYLTNYALFGINSKDTEIIFDVTGIEKSDVEKDIKTLKKFIVDGCRLHGFSSPVSQFDNFTSFRVILTLMMRYYLENRDDEKLKIVAAYMGYSMFFTTFTKFFKHGVRKETMVYTINNLTNKHKLKQVGSVDELLTYGIYKCILAYRQRLMDCTDLDLIYIVQQFKSRLRGYFLSIANKYYENDAKKEAVFASSDQLTTEEGSDFVERESSMGTVEKLAQSYTTYFFQKPIDDEILSIVSKMNQSSRTELKNALTGIRSDNAQINTLKHFYEALFFIYTEQEHGRSVNVHSKKFLSVMDQIYKKGNSKEKNILLVKNTLDQWLTQFSKTYREANRVAKINSYRKAIFQYFVFIVVLRK